MALDPVFLTKTLNYSYSESCFVCQCSGPALAVGSNAGYCYDGWMLICWLDVVRLAVV